MEWIAILLPAGFSVVIALIGAAWFLLLGRIGLIDKSSHERSADMRREMERRADSIDSEIRRARERLHDISDRLAAVETSIKYGLFAKHHSIGEKEK